MVEVAVILPVFGQSALMSEAVASLLAQQDAPDFGLVLVDDRCPDPATIRTALRLCRASGRPAKYWRAPHNSGLSAMRNAGVNLALATWPSVRAIAFLDGDDRLHARYLRRSFDALESAGVDDGPRIGWVYEDWDQFGVNEALAAPVDYQALFALAGCQHTPGALCDAAMFRNGLRFDEARRRCIGLDHDRHARDRGILGATHRKGIDIVRAAAE